MKRYLALAFVPLFFGCASHCPVKQEVAPAYEQTACAFEVPVEINNCGCGCVNQTQPYREIKHPRVVEEVSQKTVRRNCPHNEVADCGCPFKTQEQLLPQMVTYVPVQPEAYTLLANRTFNRFIKDTYDIYKETPNLKIYVKEPVLKATDLPGGYDKGLGAFKTQLQNSRAFQLTDDENDADYVLSTTIDWFDTPSKDVPAIRYVVDLLAKDETNAGSWSEIVKKADNKSWL